MLIKFSDAGYHTAHPTQLACPLCGPAVSLELALRAPLKLLTQVQLSPSSIIGHWLKGTDGVRL